MSSAAALAHAPFALLPFEHKLDRLAEVAVRIGAGLQPDQELVITAPLEAAPLVRRITEQAYRAGAKLVTTFYADDAASLARYQHAPDASFDYAPVWYYDALAAAYKSNAARMGITGANPALLAGQDPAKVSRANTAMSVAYKPAMELITRFAINWTIVAAATPAWASLVFPNDPPELALSNLWEAIFFTSRITGEDPIADWKQHNANLTLRVDYLNHKRYHSLRFFTPRQCHRPNRRPRRPAPLGRRRLNRQQWLLLQREHPHRRVLHHPAQGARQRPRLCLQASLAPGHTHRKHPLHLQGRPHRKSHRHRRRSRHQ